MSTIEQKKPTKAERRANLREIISDLGRFVRSQVASETPSREHVGAVCLALSNRLDEEEKREKSK